MNNCGVASRRSVRGILSTWSCDAKLKAGKILNRNAREAGFNNSSFFILHSSFCSTIASIAAVMPRVRSSRGRQGSPG